MTGVLYLQVYRTSLTLVKPMTCILSWDSSLLEEERLVDTLVITLTRTYGLSLHNVQFSERVNIEQHYY